MQEFADTPKRQELITRKGRDPLPRDVRSNAVPFVADNDEGADGDGPDIGRLIRKYGPIGLVLAVLGAGAGVASVVLSEPVYQVRVLLELQGINEAWLKNSFETAASYDSNQVNIQTQIKLLQGGPFLRRVSDRLSAETIPPPPQQVDFFARLRKRVHTQDQDPMQVMKQGLNSAFASFDARPVNGTRLIELSCDSTSPQMASEFINAMATEFVEETARSRSQNSQKTNDWLSAQIEETKIKLQEAEGRLQEYAKNSGNLFVGQASTLDDSKLKQLQDELAGIQADRIAKQARYEMASKSSPGSVPEVLDNEALRNYQTEIAELQRQKALLETTLTPTNPKVQKISAQLAVLEESLRKETADTLGRIKTDYESAQRRERLLASAYAAQSQRVGSIAGKSAEYNSLKREADTAQQMYQSLLVQASQADVNSSLPINPVRLVEPSTPPAKPYKPRPILNISFGVIAGLFLTGGIVFLGEKLDQSVRHPRATRRMFSAPQLGVIPSNVQRESAGVLRRMRRSSRKSAPDEILSITAEPNEALASWRGGGSIVAESFRATLASVMREANTGQTASIILITSPGPAEGKTTVASNLAIALAETGRRVLLIDADFRRPRLHTIFGVSNERGLVDLLGDKSPTADNVAEGLIAQTNIPSLSLLPNRPTLNNVSRLLYSPRLRTLFESLRKDFEMVLVDTPPLLHLADARLIATLSDGVVLVIRSGVTDRESALEACQLINDDGYALLGTILNDWNPSKARLKKHYYYDYKDSAKT
jgi:capsular exopolysaccharide synthesis family protein